MSEHKEKYMEYRVELKYLVSELQIAFLKKQLEQVLSYDKHHPNGESYSIRSLYFDDIYDSCLQENENSTDYREKYRIRIYNGDSSEIHLETKEKIHGYTRKKKEILSYEDCMCYINKKTIQLKQEDGVLKKRLYAMIQMAHYQPVQIVEYERIAMIEPTGNVRVTFDKNIGGTNCTNTFFEPVLPTVPVLPQGIHIMEVKYDELLPDYVKEILNGISLERVSFSKYYYTRKNQMINWES